MAHRSRLTRSFILYAIPCHHLDSAPPGVRKFVQDFFVPKRIFGTACMIAVEMPAIGRNDDTPWSLADWRDYEEGLTKEGDTPLDWFTAHPDITLVVDSEEDGL